VNNETARKAFTFAWLALALVACGSAVVSAPPGEVPVLPGDAAATPVSPAGSGDPSLPATADAGPQLPDGQNAVAPMPMPICGRLVATVRDFQTTHPDFEKDGLNYGILYPGLVKGELGGDGKPVYAPPGPTPTTTGAANFDQWYRDVAGVNLRFEVPLPLTEQSPGRFVFDSAAFFPIDGRGWPGDERLGHNFSFTTEIRTQFRYRGGEKFTFKGDDDVFVFVNHRLALDLGGMHGETTGTIDLDVQRTGLGLVTGQSYPLDIFHAERHTSASNFHIETSIECLMVQID
jgi:fibro-slime domain-containing protein